MSIGRFHYSHLALTLMSMDSEIPLPNSIRVIRDILNGDELDAPSEILDSLVGITTFQALIVTMELRVSFFDERPANPTSICYKSNEQRRSNIHPSFIFLFRSGKVERFTAFPADFLVMVAIAMIDGSLLQIRVDLSNRSMV